MMPLLRAFVPAALLAFCGLAVLPAAAAASDAPFLVGVCNHLAQNRGTAEQSIADMKALGANTFRDEVFWSAIEQQKGVLTWPERFKSLERGVDLAKARGIEPLIILAYGNKLYHDGRYPISDEAQAGFVRFSEFVVRHFKGRVKYFEVWNEWNQSGDPRDYTRLLKKVYPAIKKIDPSIVVLGGAVEGSWEPPTFIEALAREGALAAMDGLSIHPYVFWRGESGTPQAMFRWIERLQTMLKTYSKGRDVPLYVTEIGWPSHSAKLGISQRQAGDYASQAVLMLRSLPYVKGMWWYNLYNKGADDKDNETNFGLMTEQGKPKPAFDALQSVSDLVRNAQFVGREPSDDKVWLLRFRRAGQTDVLAVWTTEPNGPQWNLQLAQGPDDAAATISIAGAGATPGAINRDASLPVSSRPALISGPATSLKLRALTKANRPAP